MYSEKPNYKSKIPQKERNLKGTSYFIFFHHFNQTHLKMNLENCRVNNLTYNIFNKTQVTYEDYLFRARDLIVTLPYIHTYTHNLNINKLKRVC